MDVRITRRGSLCEQRSYLPGDAEWGTSPDACPSCQRVTEPKPQKKGLPSCRCRRQWASSSIPTDETNESNFAYSVYHKGVEDEIVARIANSMLAYNSSTFDYKWDPKHHKRPPGGGWRQTDSGWSRADTDVPGPVPGKDQDPDQPGIQKQGNFRVAAELVRIARILLSAKGFDVEVWYGNTSGRLIFQVPEVYNVPDKAEWLKQAAENQVRKILSGVKSDLVSVHSISSNWQKGKTTVTVTVVWPEHRLPLGDYVRELGKQPGIHSIGFKRKII